MSDCLFKKRYKPWDPWYFYYSSWAQPWLFHVTQIGIARKINKNWEQTFLLHGPIQESTAPKNLTAYFDSLQQQGFFIPYHTDSTEQQKVIHTVALLQKYQIGERKYYPAEEVQAALELMRHELGYRKTIEVKSWQPKKQSSSFVFSNKQPAYVRMYIY